MDPRPFAFLLAASFLIAIAPAASATPYECHLRYSYENGAAGMVGVIECDGRYSSRWTTLYSAERPDGTAWATEGDHSYHRPAISEGTLRDGGAPMDACIDVVFQGSGRGHRHAIPLILEYDTPFGAYTLCGIVPANVAPTAEAGDDLRALPNKAITLAATYTDPDAGDTHTATIDWGDGTIEAVIAEGGAVAGAHTYDGRGAWTVTVCVTDAAGATGCDTTATSVDGAHGKLTPDMHPGQGHAKGLAK